MESILVTNVPFLLFIILKNQINMGYFFLRPTICKTVLLLDRQNIRGIALSRHLVFTLESKSLFILSI
jgi:hypothetical protein